ncbi:phosphoglycerate dehydrogenase [Ahrensia marina]|uniref:phosphoglycerate dehydrogenase n=1 Tax=Ahrensia marina TaxID=1514904 RepID=UPI0035D0D0EF
MTSILVTPRSLSREGHPALTALEEAGFDLVMPSPGRMPDEDALIEALPGCVGWLAGVEPVSERVLRAADRLKVISRNGSGVDNLPLQALEARDITVCRTPGANARSVAELALSFIFAGFRHIVWTHEGMRTGEWPRKIGREVKGTTVSIIGLGAIGAELAQMCLDLGAHVKAYDPFAPSDRLMHPDLERVDLEDALIDVEAISLHAPMPADGSPLLTPARFDALAPHTVLVNTARAGLVDEAALLTTLESDRLACYATDVFETEPPAPSPLLEHPKVILTSHIGGFTANAVDRSTRHAVDNLMRTLGCHAD